MATPQHFVDTSAPSRTGADPRSRTLKIWAPFLTLLVAIVLLGLMGFGIDMSGLEQEEDSWGYTFAGVVVGVMYGALPLLATLVLAVVGTAIREVRGRVIVMVAGSVVTGLCGVASVIFSIFLITQAPAEAEAVFGAGCALLGLLLTWPLVWCLRVQSLRRRT